MQRTRKSLRSAFTTAFIATLAIANPVAAELHHSCNCWDGGLICVAHDENHEVVDWGYFPDYADCS